MKLRWLDQLIIVNAIQIQQQTKLFSGNGGNLSRMAVIKRIDSSASSIELINGCCGVGDEGDDADGFNRENEDPDFINVFAWEANDEDDDVGKLSNDEDDGEAFKPIDADANKINVT